MFGSLFKYAGPILTSEKRFEEAPLPGVLDNTEGRKPWILGIDIGIWNI
jgi:hypothetical protein